MDASSLGLLLCYLGKYCLIPELHGSSVAINTYTQISLFRLGTNYPEHSSVEDGRQLNVEQVPCGNAFPCLVCSVVCSTPDDLRTHERSHNIGVDEWRCQICQLDCRQFVNLKIHLLNSHGHEFKHFCFECGRGFKATWNYKAHKRLFHRVDSNCPVCKICGKIFPFESRLQTHLKSHSDNQPYCCRLCGKTYKYECSLNMHTCSAPSNICKK